MKKIVICLLISSFCSCAWKSSIYGQLRIGIALNNWRIPKQGTIFFNKIQYYIPKNGIYLQQHRPSLILGIPMECDVSKNWVIQIEPSLLGKGGNMEYISKDIYNREDYHECHFRLTYLELPILGKYKYGSQEMHIYAVLGPSLGYLTGAKVIDNSLLSFGTKTHERIPQDIIRITPRADISMYMGIGLGLKNGNNLEFRYGLGFKNLNTSDQSTAKLYNRSLQLTFYKNWLKKYRI